MPTVLSETPSLQTANNLSETLQSQRQQRVKATQTLSASEKLLQMSEARHKAEMSMIQQQFELKQKEHALTMKNIQLEHDYKMKCHQREHRFKMEILEARLEKSKQLWFSNEFNLLL